MRLAWREDRTSRDKMKMHTTLSRSLSCSLSLSLALLVYVTYHHWQHMTGR